MKLKAQLTLKCLVSVPLQCVCMVYLLAKARLCQISPAIGETMITDKLGKYFHIPLINSPEYVSSLLKIKLLAAFRDDILRKKTRSNYLKTVQYTRIRFRVMRSELSFSKFFIGKLFKMPHQTL